MKQFIKNYLNLIAMSITGMVFVITSFYFIMNYYHSDEVKKVIYISENDYNYKTQRDKIKKINDNLVKFKSLNVKNKNYVYLENQLETCYNVMKDTGSLYSLEPNKYYSSYDVYKLGGKFQNSVLNICWALHLSYLKGDNLPDEVKEIGPFVTGNVKTITNRTRDALMELQNNSSYFFTTNVTSLTLRNYLESDYQAIASSYNDFADILLNLSEVINGGK